MLVFPKAKVLRRNAAFGRHRCSLSEDKPSAAHSPAAKMDKMPVIGKSVLGGIFTHRRNYDAVGKRDAGQLQWRKQRGVISHRVEEPVLLRRRLPASRSGA